MISVILPVYNEAENVQPVFERLAQVLANLESKYEVIFVDDGSHDATVANILSLRQENPCVKLVSFSRNFGHQVALTAGMDFALGDVIVLMDADLQHPPELIGEMYKKWQEGFETVFAIRQSPTDDSFFKKVTSRLYYRIFRFLTKVDLPANSADFRLLDRKVVQALNQMRERQRFLRGLTSWVGFKGTTVNYVAENRKCGETKYTISKMLVLALDGIVSFSVVPLHLSIYAGFFLSFLGLLYSVDVLHVYFIQKKAVPGWSSIVILICLVGGLQLVLSGFTALYVGKIFEEVKQRPSYIIRDKVGFPEGA